MYFSPTYIISLFPSRFLSFSLFLALARYLSLSLSFSFSLSLSLSRSLSLSARCFGLVLLTDSLRARLRWSFLFLKSRQSGKQLPGTLSVHSVSAGMISGTAEARPLALC
jgi:hypothetical protein